MKKKFKQNLSQILSVLQGVGGEVRLSVPQATALPNHSVRVRLAVSLLLC